MKRKSPRGRLLKRHVLEILQADDFAGRLQEIRRLPGRQVVNPLFSFLCSVDERVKWHAISAMGSVVADLAAADLESARVVMRRFIWQLNDESGGIGWGCPESMAEAMALDDHLADEFWCLVVSYIQPEGNFLEHPILQRGALWAIGRLVHSRPDVACSAAPFLPPYMESPDSFLRGLAAWSVGPIAVEQSIAALERLTRDPGCLTLYRNGKIGHHTVGELAREALSVTKRIRR
ncbi:MAG: HEAT repeat domain-containing protein [Desulfobacterales bacterium]|jgi:hypothetical protein